MAAGIQRRLPGQITPSGPTGPTPAKPGQEITPYASGVNRPDPYDSQGVYAYNQLLQQEKTNFLGNANNKVNYAMSYTDPRTGMRYDYDPRTGGSGSGGSGSGGNVDVNALWQKSGVLQPPPPMPMPPQVPHVSLADDTAARNAEFAKAKDTVGRLGRSRLNSLTSEMRSRGISGSGLEGELTAGEVDKAAGALGDVANNQAIEALKRRYQIDDENYHGDITQRAQDIGVGEGNANRALDALRMRANLHSTLMQLAARNSGRVY